MIQSTLKFKAMLLVRVNGMKHIKMVLSTFQIQHLEQIQFNFTKSSKRTSLTPLKSEQKLKLLVFLLRIRAMLELSNSK